MGPYGGRVRCRALIVLLAVAALATTGCGPDGVGPSPPASATPSGPAVSAAPDPTPPPPKSAPPSSATSAPATEPVKLRGIDASHHQGAIDWTAVAGDGISFAYLKATEGTTFVDPTFADHRARAQDAGLRVGGYHYFQLCSAGADQAAHFAAVLGELDGDDLPPAVDLELAGSCTSPPAPAVLLGEVRTFLSRVEAATGRRPIVYLFPEFEDRFGFAEELAGHRQWVRSLAGRPDRKWWIWQQTDSGSVDGVAGPVDVNVMRAR